MRLATSVRHGCAWAVAGWIALLAGAASATPILTLELGAQGNTGSATAGQPLIVTVVATDIPAGSDGNGLFGFGFQLLVGPGAVAFDSITLGADWTGAQSIAVASGALSITANRVTEASGPSGSRIVLAQFQLTALAGGAYTLALAPLTGPGDNVLFDGTELDAQPGFFVGGALSVTPEPSVLALLALAAGWVAARTHGSRA